MDGGRIGQSCFGEPVGICQSNGEEVLVIVLCEGIEPDAESEPICRCRKIRGACYL